MSKNIRRTPSIKIPLRLILVAPFLLQVVLVVGVTGWISVRNGQRAVNELASQLRSEVGERVEQTLSDRLNTVQLVTQINADFIRLGTISLDDHDATADYLLAQRQQFSRLSGITIATEEPNYVGLAAADDGTTVLTVWNHADTGVIDYNLDAEGAIASTSKVDTDYDHRQRPWYRAAFDAEQAVWQAPYLTVNPARLVISFDRPIYDSQGDLQGVSDAELSLNDISDFLRSLDIGQTGTVFVVESDGNLIASSTPQSPFQIDTVTNEPGRLRAIDFPEDSIRTTALTLSERFHSLDRIHDVQQLDFTWAGERQFVQVTPFSIAPDINWLIVIAVPQSEFLGTIRSNARVTIVLCLIALAIASMIGVATSRLLVQPIGRLTRAARQLSQGNWHRSVPEPRTKELASLAKTFNQMAGQIQDSFAALEYNALHDPLTGLSNRTALQSYLQAAIDRHKSYQASAQSKQRQEQQPPSQSSPTQAPVSDVPDSDVLQQQFDLELRSDNQPLETTDRTAGSDAQTFAILILDLDNFKLVNDSFGHLFGDRLLVETAKRLQNCLFADDSLLTPNRCTISRFGGDEFVILIRHISDVDIVSQVASQILSSFEVPFNLDGIEIYMGTSIGIAISTLDGDSPERYLRNADIALYRAKNSGKATFQFFSPDMYPAALERLQLGNDLRRALQQDELELYYQPIVNVHTNQIQSFEALMRWNHPQRGRISPAEFIPIAEDTGLIVELDWWALKQACNQLKAWQQYDGCQHIEMCVNLSSKQFSQKDFLERIRTALNETQLNPRHLKLEITERIYMHSAIATETKLKQLKAFGVQLSIDDFGTGYSSLSYLYRFPIDTLKIDRSFIHSLDRVDDSSAIVESILLLGEKLGLDLVAEGVETTAQAEWLKERGCATIQGYLYSPPRPANQIDRLLAESSVL